MSPYEMGQSLITDDDFNRILEETFSYTCNRLVPGRNEVIPRLILIHPQKDGLARTVSPLHVDITPETKYQLFSTIGVLWEVEQWASSHIRAAPGTGATSPRRCNDFNPGHPLWRELPNHIFGRHGLHLAECWRAVA